MTATMGFLAVIFAALWGCEIRRNYRLKSRLRSTAIESRRRGDEIALIRRREREARQRVSAESQQIPAHVIGAAS